MNDTRTVKKTIWFSEKEVKALDKVKEETGLSYPDLIVKRALKLEQSNQDLIDRVSWESDQLKDSSKNIFTLLKNFYEEFKNFVSEFREISSSLKKEDSKQLNPYAIFAELNLTDDQKMNSYSYKKGDLILSPIDILLVVVDINHNEKTLTLSAFPLETKVNNTNLNILEKGKAIKKVWRQ